MLKKLFISLSASLCLLLVLTAIPAFAANGPVVWGTSSTITDINTFTDAGTDARGLRPGTFGAEYARMIKLANGDWLAVAAIYDNNGYTKVSWGGTRLQVSAVQTTAAPGRSYPPCGRTAVTWTTGSSCSLRMETFCWRCVRSAGRNRTSSECIKV